MAGHSGKPGHAEAFLKPHRQRPAPASVHSGPGSTPCLTLAGAAGCSVWPLRSILGSSMMLQCPALWQTPRYPAGPCPWNRSLHHTGAFLSWGPQSVPTVAGNTHENLQTAAVSQKVNFVHKTQVVPLLLWLPWPPAPLLSTSSTLSNTLAASSLTPSLSNGFLSPCCVLYLPRAQGDTQTSEKLIPAQETETIAQATNTEAPNSRRCVQATVHSASSHLAVRAAFTALCLVRSHDMPCSMSRERRMHTAPRPEHCGWETSHGVCTPPRRHQQGSSLTWAPETGQSP